MKDSLFAVPVILGTVGKNLGHYISGELLKLVHSEACINRNVCTLRDQRSASLLFGKE